jgi:predicted outer membrane repeat protein
MVTFAGNSANYGGAIDLGRNVQNDVTFNGSAVTFSKNSALSDGGAIYGENATLGLAQAIFVDNQAGQAGGALEVLNFTPHSMTFANACLLVIAQKPLGARFTEWVRISLIRRSLTILVWLSPGSNCLQFSSPPPAPVESWRAIRFTNSIVANNQGGICGTSSVPNLFSVGGGAEFQDEGHNLQFPGNQCGESIPVGDPHLDTMYIPIVGAVRRWLAAITRCP